MATRLRSTWLAGGGALLLVLAISGIAAGATLVADSTQPTVEQAEPLEADTDTTLTFEDADGDGIDDDCDDAVATDEAAVAAAAAALLAADLDGDGTISVSEAARTGWTGGANCNHGGYVSTVAHGDDACDEAETPEAGDEAASEEEAPAEPVEGAEAAACDEETEEAAAEEAPAECEAPAEEPAPEPVEETPTDTAPNAHGKAVAEVAKDPDTVGGKNCNHGGAVSEAARKDHGDRGAKQAHVHGKSAGKGHGKGHNKP
jgi:hypothetical protein